MKFKSVSRSFPLIAILLLAGIMSACHEDAWNEHVTKDGLLKSNLAEAIEMNADLTTFASVLKLTGYDNLLESAGSFTVFAPANEAWTNIDITNESEMRKLVSTLITYQTFFTKDQGLYQSLKSVSGKNIYYNSQTQTFNGASIIDADNRTANGVIHITDKVVERKDNVFEYVSTKTTSEQFLFINSLNTLVMDMEKSISIGVEASGKTKYDTAWKNTNQFLDRYPLDLEDSIFTYVIVENACFDSLYNKYKNYFEMGLVAQTDSVTKYNICQDFVFRGIVDITQLDTLTNVDGVKVPFRNVVVVDSYDASNGRIYIIQESNILLREKIKPILIEGENYNRAADANYVFTRYKLWASGERDVVLSCGETQYDSLYSSDTALVKDLWDDKTYFINSGLVSTGANFYIEYKATVNSTNYDVYYVAYDDIADHIDTTYRSFGVYRVLQKLFFSMPGDLLLKHGTANNARNVANNYLGENKCFVGDGMAGRHEVTKLTQWRLVPATQLVNEPIGTPEAEILTVPRTGTMTMWLTNTARSNSSKREGLLFLDYLLLVPRIPVE